MPFTKSNQLITELVAVGDVVDVPGNMCGTVRFVGSVSGRQGIYAGVELHPEFVMRVPGSGIFVPLSKAQRRLVLEPTSLRLDSKALSVAAAHASNSIPGDGTRCTSPSIVPKFSQSVTAHRSGISPRRPRASLPRPESPVRKLQLTPAPRQGTPKLQARFGSPGVQKISRGSHGGTLDAPSSHMLSPIGKHSIGPRSASALGHPEIKHTSTNTSPLKRHRNRDETFNVMGPPSQMSSESNDFDEIQVLKRELDARDRQLEEQGRTLAEMEASLAELQSIIEKRSGPESRQVSKEDKDIVQLRALLREKNEKISLLSAEFDAHRADFRSTIDTLEMAGSETERVYEKRIIELMQEISDLRERSEDVQSVARQLKQLEELVQELEEGLEDARRGEAEARAEVEFLRGEVERTRTELRRERQALAGGVSRDGMSPPGRELEQKEDEIRGLKAIIHSLSRDSVPDDSKSVNTVHQQLLENQSSGQQSIRHIRSGNQQNGIPAAQSISSGSVALQAKETGRDSFATNSAQPLRNTARPLAGQSVLHSSRIRGNTLETAGESDALSNATDSSMLWCEICEAAGHDILTCTNMFGPGASNAGTPQPLSCGQPQHQSVVQQAAEVHQEPESAGEAGVDAPLETAKPNTTWTRPDNAAVAGKESGLVDHSKWCAICERDGHDSVDCPFEDTL